MGRFIVTMVAIAVLVAAVLTVAGALHFQNTPDETRITIDKKELNQKTHDLVGKTEEAGSRALNKTGEALHKAAEDLRPSHDQQAPTTPSKEKAPQTPENPANDPLPLGGT